MAKIKRPAIDSRITVPAHPFGKNDRQEVVVTDYLSAQFMWLNTKGQRGSTLYKEDWRRV